MVEQSGSKTIMPERYRVYSRISRELGFAVEVGEIYALVVEDDGPHTYRFIANASDVQDADEIIRQLEDKNSPVRLAKGLPMDLELSLKESKAKGGQGVGLWHDRGNIPRLTKFIQGGSL